MGAAWVLQKRYTTILLPGFQWKKIDGAINPRRIFVRLDGDLIETKEKLGQFKEILSDEFNLPKISDIRWEQKRDAFIKQRHGVKSCVSGIRQSQEVVPVGWRRLRAESLASRRSRRAGRYARPGVNAALSGGTI